MGKTFVARALAPLIGAAPGALHLRSDEIRKRRAGVAPEARLPPEAYRPEESAAVHAEMFGLGPGGPRREACGGAGRDDPRPRAAG
jgi:predicted kinase